MGGTAESEPPNPTEVGIGAPHLWQQKIPREQTVEPNKHLQPVLLLPRRQCSHVKPQHKPALHGLVRRARAVRQLLPFHCRVERVEGVSLELALLCTV